MLRPIAEIRNEVKSAYPLIRVLEDAGIRLRPAGGAWLAALCPFPNHAETKPSFKVSRRTPDRFYCFGCDARGSVFEFVRDYYGCTTLDEQLTRLTGRGLKDWMRGPRNLPAPVRDSPATPVNITGVADDRYTPSPPSILDNTYRHLIALLGLDEAHREDLRSQRGFPDSVAYELGYRSLPVSRQTRINLCYALRGQGLDLWRIPGFFRLPRKHGSGLGQWCLGGSPLGYREAVDPATGEVFPTGGLLIPTRSLSGDIVRLVVRNDSPPVEASNELREGCWPAKYMALSSAQRVGGARATVSIHCAGPKDGGDYPGVIWVTEGQIKADISAYHLNARVLGQPGVGQAMQQVLDATVQEGALSLYIAHDAEDKIQVLTAIRRLALRARPLGINSWVVRWDPRLGKGLDNLLTSDGDWEIVPSSDWWNTLLPNQRASVEGRLQGSCVN